MDNQIEKQPQTARSPEAEKPAEAREPNSEQLIQGAEILENPPDNSFIHGLQLFIAWARDLIAKKD